MNKKCIHDKFINLIENMILFSEFLNKHYPKLINSNKIFNQAIIQDWLTTLKGFHWLDSLNLFSIYTELYTAFEKNLTGSMDKFITQYPSEVLREPTEFTNLLDQQSKYLRDGVFFLVKLYTKKNPYPFPSFRFEPEENGVSVEAYLVKQKKSILIGASHGGLGKENADELLQKKIVSQIKPFCQGLNEHFETVRDRAIKSKYHGEEAWMVEFVPQLIQELKKINPDLFIKKELINFFDSIWLRNFVHYPRLEFILNSAPCEHCQNLFKNLRLMLNQEGLFIPILIFSIYPYNTAETEMSQLNVLSFNGQFIQTDIFLNTIYDQKDRPVKNISAFASLEHALLFDTKVYSLLSQLNMMMGDSIPQQFFAGLHQYLNQQHLSKTDLGIIKAFLDRFPEDFRNKGQQEYQACLDSLKTNSPVLFNPILTAENINTFFQKILPKETKELMEIDTESEWDDISSQSTDFDESDMESLSTLFTIFSYNNPQESSKYISLNLIMSVLIITLLKKIHEKNNNDLHSSIGNP